MKYHLLENMIMINYWHAYYHHNSSSFLSEHNYTYVMHSFQIHKRSCFSIFKIKEYLSLLLFKKQSYELDTHVHICMTDMKTTHTQMNMNT